MKFRQEKDAMGVIDVPADALWGAQTQRSLEHFPQDSERMPLEQIYALALVKKAAAICNFKEGKLDEHRKQLIVQVADEIIAGKHDQEFPLTVWQTGSGTQTNMNVNEVIANRANQMVELDAKFGCGSSMEGLSSESNQGFDDSVKQDRVAKSNRDSSIPLLHPNDHVNMSQSSNDTFPTAMHIATFKELRDKLIPAAHIMLDALETLSEKYNKVIKTGRTHLQDATPITMGQEIHGWKTMLETDLSFIEHSMKQLRQLAIGGTAVGTGINASKSFGDAVAKEISYILDADFISNSDKFYELSSKGTLVHVHSALKGLASNLYKIASDIRILSCGPRSGIAEYIIPSNEPGSSIMPGKVNPTQVESLTMICLQVMANDTAISMANTQGQLQLNTYMPLIIHNMLQSISLLSKGIDCFTHHLLTGLEPNTSRINFNLEQSLMLVTSLSPHIGYDKASQIAKNAHAKNITLKQSTLELGYLSEEEFDSYMDYDAMI